MEDVTTIDAASAIAERIVAVISEPLAIQGRQICVGASIGIAYSCGAGDTADELMRDADLAMDHAKDDGKSQYVVFDPGILGHSVHHKTGGEARSR